MYGGPKPNYYKIIIKAQVKLIESVEINGHDTSAFIANVNLYVYINMS